MNYYFATIFFTVFLMVVLQIITNYNELLARDKKIKLILIAWLVIVASLAEWLGGMLNEKPSWLIPLHVAIKAIEYSIAPAIPLLAADILGTVKFRKTSIAFLLTHAVLELFSCFFGFIFFVDEQNVHRHGPLYFIYIAAFALAIGYFIGMTLKVSFRETGLRKAYIFIIPLFLLCGLYFQYSGNNIKVIWLCCAIDMMLLYIFYMELLQHTDALTHLFNRKWYESRIVRIRESAVVFYFDVDNFKGINDQFGHAYGDVALAGVGKCIYDVYGKSGECYRIGGDEFCAVSYIRSSEAEKIVSAFYAEIENRKKQDRRFPSVSVGYACFSPSKNDIADVIEKADKMMYSDKRNKKEGTPQNAADPAETKKRDGCLFEKNDADISESNET